MQNLDFLVDLNEQQESAIQGGGFFSFLFKLPVVGSLGFDIEAADNVVEGLGTIFGADDGGNPFGPPFLTLFETDPASGFLGFLS